LIGSKVTDDKGHFSDNSQGSLEVPCNLIFEGEKKYIQKIGKLLTNSEKETVEGVSADMLLKNLAWLKVGLNILK